MNTKIMAMVAAVFVGGGLIYFIGRTISQQSSTEREMEKLKQQMRAQTAPAAASGPSVVIGAVGAEDSLVVRERAIHDVVTEGYRLLNTREPAKVEKAIQIFQEGLAKVDPQNTDLYHGLGRGLLVLKRYPEAIKAFQDGLAINPKKADLSSGLGWAFYNQADYFHAKEAWETALANDPKSQDAWSVMAWVYLGLQDRDKAIVGFRVLVDSAEGANRTDWKNGLTMARASNYQIDQIRSQFPLPDPQLFSKPTTKP